MKLLFLTIVILFMLCTGVAFVSGGECTDERSGAISMDGWLTIGHEVRTFQPCGRSEALWLVGHSPAMQAIVTAYRQALPGGKAYQPLFVVLAGELVDPPADGFGADYEKAFLATQLVRVARGESCDYDNPAMEPQSPNIEKRNPE